jgi:addiction module HigA family antidote
MHTSLTPAHPGEILRTRFPIGMTVTDAAQSLKISRVTLSKVLNARCSVTAGMALRLAAWLGTPPDFWLEMQIRWDLWQAKQQAIPNIQPLSAREYDGSLEKP